MEVRSGCQKSGFCHFFEFSRFGLVALLPAVQICKEYFASETPRPAGKPGGDDCSQRGCGPSDTSYWRFLAGWRTSEMAVRFCVSDFFDG